MGDVTKLFGIVARSSENGEETVIHCNREVLMECLAAAKAEYEDQRSRIDQLDSTKEERECDCALCRDSGVIAWKGAGGDLLVSRCFVCEFRDKMGRFLYNIRKEG